MPPAAPKGKGLDLKRLPPWAWVLAIAGGAIVGFVLLRRPAREEESGEEPGAEGEGAPSRGGGGGGAPPRELLDAWGLTESYEAPMYGDSGGFDYGDSGGDDVAPSFTGENVLYQDIKAPSPTTTQSTGLVFDPSAPAQSVSTLFTLAPTSSPSSTDVGSGSQFVKAL